MNPKHLDAMVLEICDKYNYPLPKRLTLNRRFKTTLGKCTSGGEIELNEWVVLNNKKEVVVALIKHEICHLRHFNHSKEFKQAIKIMGSAMYIEDLFPNMILPKR